MSSPRRSAKSRGFTMTVCAHPSQRSQASSLPRRSSMARWACRQASSFGVGCQSMPAMVARFAASGKLVALAAGLAYILKCR
jgi:hypothetical protein